MRSLRAGVLAAVGFGLAPVVGCTFLATFDDDTSADGGPARATDATMDEDASSNTDSSIHVTNPDANMLGDDDAFEGDSSSPYYDFPPPGTAPPGAGRLLKSANPACDPCMDYPNNAYTCAAEHNGSDGCRFDDSAIYECPGDGGGDVVVAYECPNEQSCYPAKTHNAICNPCNASENGGGTSYVTTPYTNSKFNVLACVECIGGSPHDIVECSTTNCPCTADTFDGGT